MSYGQKPAAWARPGGGNQNQQQLNQNIFANQLGLAAGQAFGAMPTAAMSLNSSLNALVNQAAFSNMNNMNNVLAQAQAAQRLLPQNVPQQNRQGQSPPPSRNQRTFVGTVTKLMETYGFVDEDVFFQTNVIRGAMPRVGDRVMVEASFNPSMPFKWNACRIQLPQDAPPNLAPPQNHHQSYSGRNAAPSQPQQQQHSGGASSGNRWQSDRRDDGLRQQNMNNERPHRQLTRRSPAPLMRTETRRSPRRSPVRKSPSRKSPVRAKPQDSLKREREKSQLRDNREVAHNRSPAASVAASGKRDADSPPRRRQRIIPRYHCYKPKPLVHGGELTYSDLHRRYTNLYIPSDFVRSQMSWLKSIQLDSPIQISPYPVTFSVLHKDVDIPLDKDEKLLPENPHDADNRYVVKLLLLSHPGLSALRQKTYGLLADGSISDAGDTLSIIKNLQFVVGVKGKSEYMCLGGAWSPSLDGENPLDPQTQINTAVRTARLLIGVDLSFCAKWYKMVHLHYFRAERNRVDSVVLLLPDTSSMVSLMPPSAEAFNELEAKLKEQLAQKLAAIDAEQFASESSSTTATATVESVDSTIVTNLQLSNEQQSEINGVGSELHQSNKSSANIDDSGDNAKTAENQTVSETMLLDASQSINTTTAALAVSSEGNEQENPNSQTSLTPQSIKNMKVVELREELDSRGLDSKGVKNVLLQRLQEALESSSNAGNNESAAAEIEPPSSAMVVIKQELVEAMEVDSQQAAEQEKIVDNVAAAEKAKEEQEKLEKEQKALEKAKEKFEKDKKDRKAALERHYILPKDASTFIYPNKTAKNGKFDCKITSLASLLDYRLDDNKESSFELFLFAEAFRECLDRQNAFIIYQNLEAAIDRESEQIRRDAALVEATNDNESDDIIILETDVEAKKKKNAKLEKKVDLRTNFKAIVNHVDAFASFAHFDENVCGYIEDRDLEEILYCTGIDLSRSEVQKLIKKFSTKDGVNYRNFTDKWVDNEGNVKYSPPSFFEIVNATDLAKGHYSSELKSAEPALGTTPDVTDTGVVFFKGTVLNIIQTMDQHKIVEKERTAAVLKNDELDMQLKATKKQRDHIEKTKRRLEEDFDRYKKKLYEAEKCLKATQDISSSYKDALLDCKKYAQRIFGAVDKAIPPPKKELKKDKKSMEKSNSEISQKDKSDAKYGLATNENGVVNANGDEIAEDIVLTEEVEGNDDALDEVEFVEIDGVEQSADSAQNSVQTSSEQQLVVAPSTECQLETSSQKPSQQVTNDQN